MNSDWLHYNQIHQMELKSPQQSESTAQARSLCTMIFQDMDN